MLIRVNFINVTKLKSIKALQFHTKVYLKKHATIHYIIWRFFQFFFIKFSKIPGSVCFQTILAFEQITLELYLILLLLS